MKRLLIWDAPNMDRALTTRLGHVPTRSERPDFQVLMSWLNTDLGNLELLPCLFMNVITSDPARLTKLTAWVDYMTRTGFRVFSKPSRELPDHTQSDIDEEMVAEIALHHRAGQLKELIVASHDAARFSTLLTQLAEVGVLVTVIGWSHDAGTLRVAEGVNYVEITDIPSLFSYEVPSSIVDLNDLPPQGKWFVPAAHQR